MPTVALRGGYQAGQECTRWAADKDEVTVVGYSQLPDGRHVTCFSGRKGHALRVLCVLVVFSMGLVTGLIVKRLNTDTGAILLQDDLHLHQTTSDAISKLYSHMDMKRVVTLLREVSSEVHLTGTHANSVLRDHLVTLLQGQGHLHVTVATYTALLSYPNWEKPNRVSLVYKNSSVAMLLNYTGPAYTNHPELAQAYVAFAANDTVQADLVYANYGEEGDFAEMAARGVACNNNIVVMKLGKIYSSLKVSNAEKCGARGVLLYSEASHAGVPVWATPHDTVLAISGDPTTPLLPSLDGVFRLPLARVAVPTIPVQSVSEEQAKQLLAYMTGPRGSSSFDNCVTDNVTCRLGPGFRSPRHDMQVKVEVNNEMELRAISNVLATLRGSVEPDRLVIVGSHYDAWSYGATDSVGTALLMELARIFSQLTETGWRPRRTLVFIHWDGTQQGLMGSTEFVEEHYAMLRERTVAYVNLDSPVRGQSTLCVDSTPLLHTLATNISQQVHKLASSSHFTSQLSESVGQLSESGDHVPFVYTLGVSAIRPYMDNNACDSPVQHLPLNTFDHLSADLDPGFLATELMLKLATELVLQLSTNNKLPFDCCQLAHFLQDEFDSIQASLHVESAPHITSMGRLQSAIDNFSSSAEDFHRRFESIDDTDSLLVRQYNDCLMKLMQVFIHSPGTPHYRNILLPSGMHSVKGSAFPAIREALAVFESSEDSRLELWQEVDRQVSVAVIAVRAAVDLLTDSV